MKKFQLMNIIEALLIMILLFVSINLFATKTYFKGFFVIDGDTFKNYDSISHEVKVYRIANIDSPEKNQIFGSESTKFLTELMNQNDVRINVVNIDRYGRNICEVFINNQRLDSIMVVNGYSFVYTQYCHFNKLFLLQQSARVQKKGVWKFQPIVYPWDYRKHH